MKLRKFGFTSLLALSVATAAGGAFPVNVLAAEQSHLAVSENAQTSVGITIYKDFALVREVRELNLPKGKVSLEYQDVPSRINPGSVLTRSMASPNSLVVLEQSYQYQLINRQNLLQHNLGEEVSYIEQHKVDDGSVNSVRRSGKLLAVNPEIVDFGGQVEVSPKGTISFDSVPSSLGLKPSLVWLLDNVRGGKQKIETSYLVSNLGWTADYVMVLDKNKFDVNTWVTINNQSGADYNDVSLQLIAGDVNRTEVQPRMKNRERGMMMMADAGGAEVMTRDVFDYHQYTLPNKTGLKHNETRQIRFFDASGVKFKKRYQLNSTVMAYRMGDEQALNPEVKMNFVNSKSNRLGEALPAGTAKVYARQDNGSLLLLGEDNVSHTAKDDEVELTLGKAFDIKVNRKQTAFKNLSDRVKRVSYEVEVKNRKDKAIQITLNEQLDGDWRMIEQSQKGKKTNSRTQSYVVEVAANSTQVLNYVAEIRY